jgi:hypothetical protein
VATYSQFNGRTSIVKGGGSDPEVNDIVSLRVPGDAETIVLDVYSEGTFADDHIGTAKLAISVMAPVGVSFWPNL